MGKPNPIKGNKPFQPGNTLSVGHGRPKSLLTEAKGMGYKPAQVKETLEHIINLPPEELQAVADDKERSVLEIWVAKVIIKAMKDGNLQPLEMLLSRMHGAPKQDIDIKTEQKIVQVIVTPDGRRIEF